MEMIAHVLKQGRQVIVLIPEISLTYQTVMRFLPALWILHQCDAFPSLSRRAVGSV